MAEQTLLSPGVLARENDQSFVTSGPVTVGAAIIGPTVKGPVEVPTVVTSYSDYISKFGGKFLSGSDYFTFFTSIAAYNYFNKGGKSLLVSRVVSGSYTSATSSAILNSLGSSSFTLETISKGIIMNNSGALDSYGALASGSSDNIRWEIVSTNSASGLFTLNIRQGNDTTNQKIVLETWTNLSLDPNSPNYISQVIGNYVYNYNPSTNQIEVSGSYPNASSYVRVKEVLFPTPDYLNNAGLPQSQFTSSLPVLGSGSFSGAIGNIKNGANMYGNINSSNTQGLVGANYNNMISLLSNKDDYKFNILLTPGIYASDYISQINNIISNTQNRGDNVYVTDLVPYGSNVSAVSSQANSFDTSYAASYWPWVQVRDTETGKRVWVPASTMIGGVYAFNDSVSAPWFAPAGITRGSLTTVLRAEQKLSQAQRDTLYSNKVNPIATFPGQGIVVYGQKTLQTKASALDRVNVRRLLIELKSYISQIGNTLVFEQNTIATRNNFLSQVNPYLDNVRQRQGLYAYRVVMDDTNNTADVIDQNQLVGKIYLQPTKTAEFVLLDFNITPTGATFS
jgi:hypothetical protein